jgi:Tol biopolymer transport system component
VRLLRRQRDVRVFINYRKHETSGQAGRLYDALAARYGEDSVFMDTDTIGPGEDYREMLGSAVGRCDALIALIGPDWLTATDEEGRRRLDSPDDWVRVEIESALGQGVRVIPALVDGAKALKAEQLPESLQAFAHRQAIKLGSSAHQWRYDVSRLAAAIEKSQPGDRPRRRPSRGALLAAAGAAVAGAIVAIVLLGFSGSEAKALGKPGDIVFLDDSVPAKMSQDGTNVVQIYPDQMSSTGFKGRATTSNTVHPSWSPDRRHIVLAKDGDIQVLSAGGRLKNLTKTPKLNEDNPAWSPDGRHIAYGRYSTTDSCGAFCERIYVMDADGHHVTRLRGGPGNGWDFAPAWSPDGKQIAYTSIKSSVGTHHANIWVMNADGSNAHQVTHVRGYNRRPAWSPDGKRIAFESDANAADFTTCDPKSQCRYSIAVIDAEGRQRSTLVTNPTDPANDAFPLWLTRTTLLFTANSTASSGGDIWRINADGTGPKQITTDGTSQYASSVAP